jgi:hypothetical protein
MFETTSAVRLSHDRLLSGTRIAVFCRPDWFFGLFLLQQILRVHDRRTIFSVFSGDEAIWLDETRKVNTCDAVQMLSWDNSQRLARRTRILLTTALFQQLLHGSMDRGFGFVYNKQLIVWTSLSLEQPSTKASCNFDSILISAYLFPLLLPTPSILGECDSQSAINMRSQLSQLSAIFITHLLPDAAEVRLHIDVP